MKAHRAKLAAESKPLPASAMGFVVGQRVRHKKTGHSGRLIEFRHDDWCVEWDDHNIGESNPYNLEPADPKPAAPPSNVPPSPLPEVLPVGTISRYAAASSVVALKRDSRDFAQYWCRWTGEDGDTWVEPESIDWSSVAALQAKCGHAGTAVGAPHCPKCGASGRQCDEEMDRRTIERVLGIDPASSEPSRSYETTMRGNKVVSVRQTSPKNECGCRAELLGKFAKGSVCGECLLLTELHYEEPRAASHKFKRPDPKPPEVRGAHDWDCWSTSGYES